MHVEQALAHWRREGLLSEEKARELEASLETLTDERSSKAMVVFGTLGAILIGVGILLFVASNWGAMGPVLRGAVLFGTYGVVVAAAWSVGQRGYERVAEALWFLAALAFGADVFFLGQIFNFTLTFWQGPLVWLLGVLAMGFARRRQVYGHVAAPLLLLFLGWLGGGAGWFMDDQWQFLVADGGLRPLLPLLGVGLVSLALLANRIPAWEFLVRACRSWGLLLIAVPLVGATVARGAAAELFDADWTTKQLTLAVIVCLLAIAAVVAGAVRVAAGRGVLAGAGLVSVALAISPSGESLAGELIKDAAPIYLLFVALLFALGLLTVWLGFQSANRALVNTGMASLAVLILIQYFSWSFGLLARSAALVVGGLVVLALAYFMERARRRLLARMRTP